MPFCSHYSGEEEETEGSCLKHIRGIIGVTGTLENQLCTQHTTYRCLLASTHPQLCTECTPTPVARRPSPLFLSNVRQNRTLDHFSLDWGLEGLLCLIVLLWGIQKGDRREDRRSQQQGRQPKDDSENERPLHSTHSSRTWPSFVT